jgi:carboxymethylenebutenolidase
MGKLALRIVLGVLGALLVLVIILVASVFVDGALGGGRITALTNLTIPGVNGQPDVQAYVARPDGEGPFPAVIMIHEFYGLNESIVGKAEGLADEGYVVVAPDTFRGSTTSWIPRAIYQVITTDPAQVNLDLDSVRAWLDNDPAVDSTRVGIAGFCYGGRASLAYSLHNPAGITATVVFYGSPETDPQTLATLNGPVLGIFGGADTSIPLADVAAFETGLNEAGIANQISVYEGQPHAFVTDIESIRQGGVQAQAWQEMVDFLNANLKAGSPQISVRLLGNYVAPLDWGYYWRLAISHTFEMESHGH